MAAAVEIVAAAEVLMAAGGGPTAPADGGAASTGGDPSTEEGGEGGDGDVSQGRTAGGHGTDVERASAISAAPCQGADLDHASATSGIGHGSWRDCSLGFRLGVTGLSRRVSVFHKSSCMSNSNAHAMGTRSKKN